MSQEPKPLFMTLDGNTLFTAVYAWLHEDDTTGSKTVRNATGTWAWEDVRTVQTMDPLDFPEMIGPRSAVQAGGGWIYLRVDYQTVLTAWRQYRLRYGNQFLTFTQAN